MRIDTRVGMRVDMCVNMELDLEEEQATVDAEVCRHHHLAAEVKPQPLAQRLHASIRAYTRHASNLHAAYMQQHMCTKDATHLRVVERLDEVA